MAFAGGFAKEDHVFKAIALGSPYVKLVCMGRALMIPGFLGSNIEGVLRPENKEKVHGNWDKLPASVAEFGSKPEEIFAGWYEVEKKVGKNEMKNIPFGAVACWTLADKITAGVQQLMAGARKFSVEHIDRNDITALTEESAKISGIKYVMELDKEEAIKILNS